MADTLADTLADDAAVPDPAPKGRKRPAASSAKGGKRAPRTSARGNRLSIERELRTLLETVGSALSIVEPFDGAVVLSNAATTARKLDDLAKESAHLHRVLSLLVTGGGAVPGAVIAVAPIALPILLHHGLLPSTPAVSSVVGAMTPPEAHAAAAERDEAAAVLRDLFAAPGPDDGGEPVPPPSSTTADVGS